VERAVRRGRLGQGLEGTGQGLGWTGQGRTTVVLETSKGKKTREKRIGKSVPQLQAIMEQIQRVRNGTGGKLSKEEDNEDTPPLTSQYAGPLEREANSNALANSASKSGALQAGGGGGAGADIGGSAAVGTSPVAGPTAGVAAAAAAGAGPAAARAAARPARGGRVGSRGGSRGGRGGRTALGRRIPASARMQ
jgi:hypothetical protein